MGRGNGAVHARCERQPLVFSEQTNEVWRMDFVFDELANGRKIKTLTVMDQVKAKRWLPIVI